MRYIGGKNRIARDISEIVLSSCPTIVVEPFCGALWITMELVKQNSSLTVLASDIHDDLIDMWQAVKEGWLPPDILTRDEYHELKTSPSSPLRTFAGYGCSFGGKWFGGYASDNTGRNYAKNAHNSVKKRQKILSNVIFSKGSYLDQDIPRKAVVYCDPPYASTTKPGTRSSFDHDVFWNWVDSLENICYVSEYHAPSSMSVAWQKHVRLDMNTSKSSNRRIEKLFLNRDFDLHKHNFEASSLKELQRI